MHVLDLTYTPQSMIKVTTNLWFLDYLHFFSIVISENKMFAYNISL